MLIRLICRMAELERIGAFAGVLRPRMSAPRLHPGLKKGVCQGSFMGEVPRARRARASTEGRALVAHPFDLPNGRIRANWSLRGCVATPHERATASPRPQRASVKVHSWERCQVRAEHAQAPKVGRWSGGSRRSNDAPGNKGVPGELVDRRPRSA